MRVRWNHLATDGTVKSDELVDLSPASPAYAFFDGMVSSDGERTLRLTYPDGTWVEWQGPLPIVADGEFGNSESHL